MAGAQNAGWRELYDGFVPDIRLQKLMRKGLFRWWRAELLNLRFVFSSRKQLVTLPATAAAEVS